MATRKRTRAASPLSRKRIRTTSTTTSTLNQAPAQKLNIFVFGTNESGEMGLGSSIGPDDVEVPTLNSNLDAEAVGVVQLAAGGMHSAALTHDNRILTWGVNDLGALGRDTTWDGGLVDMKDAEEDMDADINPLESTPTEIDMANIPKDTVFTQVTAGDNATFALTATGHVYGWGTMRSSDGVAGFLPETKIQRTPIRMPHIDKVTRILAGNNHVVALASDGGIYTWGAGEQGQLGRRLLERRKQHGLIPQKLGLRKIVQIGVGADHSFAINQDGTAYSWGSNNYGQTGIPSNAGEDSAIVWGGSVIKALKGIGNIVDITGGNKHTLALTDAGNVYAWGQLDGFATGISLEKLPGEGVIRDHRGKPRILERPMRIEGLQSMCIAAGGEHSLAVSMDGTAFSWGFNNNHQTGHGDDDDIETPKVLSRKSIRDRVFSIAYAGGNFSILAEKAN